MTFKVWVVLIRYIVWCPSIGIWCLLSWLEQDYGFLQDDHRDEVLLITLYQRYMLSTGLTSDNVNLKYLAKVVCLTNFSTVNLYTYPLPWFILWKQITKHSPHSRGRELQSISLARKYLHKLFGILYLRRFEFFFWAGCNISLASSVLRMNKSFWHMLILCLYENCDFILFLKNFPLISFY